MTARTVVSTLRHAQTTYGAQNRYAGSIDVPLSEEGARQAAEAAPRLEGAQFDVVITSNLHRAVETARILAGDVRTLVQTDLCRERTFGIMEGMTWEEVQGLDPPVLFIEVGGDLHSVNPAGAEPFEDVWERAKQFREILFQRYSGASILVISHGVFLQMFHGLLRGLSCIESLGAYPANLELSTFQFAGTQLESVTVTKLGGDGTHF